MNFAPPERSKTFQCSKCPRETQQLRRCHESREDFTYKDHAGVFPILVTQNGEPFSFCPGKANWDPTIVSIFNSLIITAETGCMLNAGGMYDQPDWYIELLSLFIVRYNEHKFWSRAKAILGDGSKPKTDMARKRG